MRAEHPLLEMFRNVEELEIACVDLIIIIYCYFYRMRALKVESQIV